MERTSPPWARPLKEAKNQERKVCSLFKSHLYVNNIDILLVSADKYIWFLQGMSTTMPRFTSSSRQAPNPIVISHDANDDWLNTDDVFRGNASDDEQVNQKKVFHLTRKWEILNSCIGWSIVKQIPIANLIFRSFENLYFSDLLLHASHEHVVDVRRQQSPTHDPRRQLRASVRRLHRAGLTFFKSPWFLLASRHCQDVGELYISLTSHSVGRSKGWKANIVCLWGFFSVPRVKNSYCTKNYILKIILSFRTYPR